MLKQDSNVIFDVNARAEYLFNMLQTLSFLLNYLNVNFDSEYKIRDVRKLDI